MGVCIAREQQDVFPPLVVPLSVVMLDVFAQCPPQGAFAEEDHFRQALLLHRPDPTLRIGIQVRAARGQQKWFDLTRRDDRPEGLGVFSVPIVQEIATVPQDAASLKGAEL